MSRLPLSSVLLVALGLTGAACNEGTMRTEAQPTGYFDSADAPLVAPVDQNATSSSTAKAQAASGYFPSADAPLVSPDQSNVGAASTLKKQEKSGYFPEADAPLVPRNPSDPQ
jgi:hypothetical protein